jgi:two-component system invasion response regulator UvrY
MLCESIEPVAIRKTKLLLVDDDALIREGLKETVEAQSDVVVAGEAGSVHDALELLRRERFDVIVLDVHMPERSGFMLLQRVCSEWPDTKVLMLSGYPESEYGPQALREGAHGFLGKNLSPAVVLRAIRAVAGGAQYVSPALRKHMGSELRALLHRRKHGLQLLSKRENEVLRLLVSGKRATEISVALALSVKTVSTYRSRIMRKVGVASLAELVRYAVNRGVGT